MTAILPKPFVTFHFKVQLKSTTHGTLPKYKNSMFRGVIARKFRENVCHDMKLACSGCAYLNNCQYSALFESPETSAAMLNHGRSVPHPYIISCDSQKTEFIPGDALEFHFLLFGTEVAKYLPQLFMVLQQMEAYPLGKEQMLFSLERILQETPSDSYTVMNQEFLSEPHTVLWEFSLPENYQTIFIQFSSPFRSQKQGKILREFHPDIFFEQLKRRYTQLHILYGEDQLLPEFPAAPDASSVKLLYQNWEDVPRYSSTHHRKMKLGGIIAGFQLERSEETDAWLPYILFGEKFHVGKATTFGMGKYTAWIK